MTQDSYDYIIAGGGMAGLSLAFYLNESSLRSKKILIIDKEAKDFNDHTWCFWQNGESAFEEIVFHRWKTLWFFGESDFSRLLELEKYRYKMIRAKDFYEFIKARLRQNSNISFLQAAITEIKSAETSAFVATDRGDFTAGEYVFESITRKTYDNPQYRNLLQHFTGWFIKTERETFNPERATLFDFRIEQKDECRFVYVLPFSPNEALIEFTVFSDNLLEKSEYDFYLKNYISEILKIENYEIRENEAGIIPMSDEPHEENPAPRVIRIGTAGGYVKASTGYSFARTQRRLQKIVENLESENFPVRQKLSKRQIWKNYLDSVMLDVLQTKKHPAADVFTALFRRTHPDKVLKFLDEDTTLGEDIQIMQTVPLKPFTESALKIGIKKFGS